MGLMGVDGWSGKPAISLGWESFTKRPKRSVSRLSAVDHDGLIEMEVDEDR